MYKQAFAVLSKETERGLAAACRERLPLETCGVLFGRMEQQSIIADGFALIRNAARLPTASFSFAPEDWVRAYYEADKNRRQIVGFFHSHPGGSPVPSPEDQAGSLPWGTYWIMAVTQHAHQISAYRREPDNRWHQLALK
jgi:proteasome lid subunit RPN8/RPN11